MNKVIALAELDAGIYLARIDDVYVGKAKSTGNPMVKTTLELRSGGMAGRSIWKNHMLTSAKGVEQCLKEWKQLGIAIKKPEELMTRMDEIKGLHIKVKIEQGNAPSCYFAGRVPAEAVQAVANQPTFEEKPWETVVLDGREARAQVFTTNANYTTPTKTVVVRPPIPLTGDQIGWQQEIYDQIAESILRLQSAS